YYRDIGHQLEYDYIKPYIHPSGLRVNTGIKYWRITGRTEYKEAYRPDWAREKAAQHAGHFMFNRQQQINHLAGHMDRKPIVVAPYDAELYGHWWYEGPMFLNFLFRKMCYDQDEIKTITPSEYLQEYSTNQMAMPSTSSWGYRGYSEYWVDGTNDWIYRHIHKAGDRMVELAAQFKKQIASKKGNALVKRALNQAGRELLLAQSSDWPFIMKSGTMVPYANRRVRLHISRFTRLYDDIRNNTIDQDWLAEVEWRDNIFAEMDVAKYYV
ncbi:MAG TPA: 1,4-alpha-glucan branching protein domain-containing protein, partial [Candidatus Bathyarchaeia archaeon]|nr:1,4-alpha-glucan branching protein domain-containing protein [Candidatus Bathyarchaeia archaeon]